MDSTLMLIGLVGMLVFGIMTIVSLVKKNDKAKKNAIRTGIGFIIFALSLTFQPTTEEASVSIDGETMKYEELLVKIDEKEKELSDVETKISDIDAQYKEKETEFNEALKIVENKTNAQKELDDLNGNVNGKKNELKKMDDQLKAKSDELASLQGKITKAAGEPKTLGAGTYTVGQDIPASRYTVEAIGDGSNFFVNEGSKVNTILGGGDWGEESYTFYAEDGDTIQTEAKVKLTPVE